MKNKIILALLAFAILLAFAPYLLGAHISLPYPPTSGSVIRSSEALANWNACVAGVNAVDDRATALKNGDVVALASYTYVKVMGEVFSTTATAATSLLINATSSSLIVGTATGAYDVWLMGSASGPGGGYYPYGFKRSFTVWVATTTEIVAGITKLDDRSTGSALWDMAVATSSVRGEITQTGSGTVGVVWKSRVWAIGPDF